MGRLKTPADEARESVRAGAVLARLEGVDEALKRCALFDLLLFLRGGPLARGRDLPCAGTSFLPHPSDEPGTRPHLVVALEEQHHIGVIRGSLVVLKDRQPRRVMVSHHVDRVGPRLV